MRFSHISNQIILSVPDIGLLYHGIFSVQVFKTYLPFFHHIRNQSFPNRSRFYLLKNAFKKLGSEVIDKTD